MTEMEYQHLVFEEFARKVQPAINPFEPFAFTQPDLDPSGPPPSRPRGLPLRPLDADRHDLPGEPDGTHNDISLLDGFLNPPSYTDNGTLSAADAAGSIIMGMSDQVGNELDEFTTETLRNNLLGLPLDPVDQHGARPVRGRPGAERVPSPAVQPHQRRQLKPYTSWVDFGENIKHPESLRQLRRRLRAAPDDPRGRRGRRPAGRRPGHRGGRGRRQRSGHPEVEA